MFERPVIDTARCDGCGLCVSVCPQGALVIVTGVVCFEATIDCPWCGECEAVCPQGAISCPFEILFGEG